MKTALNAIRAAVDVMAEARQYIELRGELTGELPKVADAAANVTLVRVLSVPRMPGVETVHGMPMARLESPTGQTVKTVDLPRSPEIRPETGSPTDYDPSGSY